MATLATSISSVALHLPILAVVARVATMPLAWLRVVLHRGRPCPRDHHPSGAAVGIAEVTAAVTLSTTDADADADAANTDTAAYADLRADHAGTAIDRASVDDPGKNSDHGGTASDTTAKHVTNETGLFDVLVKNRWGRSAAATRTSAGKHSSPRESRKY